LWTLSDKKKIINTLEPSVGSVAVMAVGAFGHVGVVTYVGRNHITIQEANYYTCRLSERHGDAKAFKIVGYFKPKK
jgi:surface antigen